MSASDEQVQRLRRMVAEPTAATYTNETLAGYIERFPLPDSMGPESIPGLGHIAALEANPDWTASYDLNAAAADVWDEKAAALANQFGFSEDGQAFQRQQMYEQAQKQARHYRARRSASVIRLRPDYLLPGDAVPVANRAFPLGG